MTNQYEYIIIGAGQIGGLKSCLSAWKSVKTDSTVSPRGFQVLSSGL